MTILDLILWGMVNLSGSSCCSILLPVVLNMCKLKLIAPSSGQEKTICITVKLFEIQGGINKLIISSPH